MNETDDQSRFTIRDEEAAPDAIYVADAENLRIEKLGTRITLVAVLIPCLLVVVLAVAYLDIKNRVISTQNTGSMGVQNLSKDLESRFSNLSLKQAKIDKQLTEMTDTVQTATAALQVNLKKTTAQLKRIADGKSDRSALAAMSKKTDGAIAGLRKQMADLNAQFNTFDDELATQIQVMAEGLKKDQGRLAEIENKASQIETKSLRLEKDMLSKASMELTLGLERLALQEMVKDKVRELEKQLTAIGKQIDRMNQRLDTQSSKISPSSSSAASPPAPSPLPPAASDTPSGATGIKEQTIN